MNESQFKQLLANIEANKRKTQLPVNKDLFGEDVSIEMMKLYNDVFNHIIKDKQYIFIPGQVIGKKNNYTAMSFYTGLSTCCNSTYDKKTRICHKCGNPTSSSKKTGKIDLNEKAMAYKKGSLQSYIKNVGRFKQLNANPKFALVGIFIIRDNNRRFDFDNMKTMIGDQMTSSGMIEDDSADKLMLIPLGYKIDSAHPGVILKPISFDNYLNFILSV